MSNKNLVILAFGDLHVPYQHIDAIPFLRACHKEYQPTRCVNLGDMVDCHALSFHESDPDLNSPGQELKSAVYELQELYDFIDELDSVDSNHSSLFYRRAKYAGIPRDVLRSYRSILHAPAKYNWHLDLTIKLPNKKELYFHHGLGSNASLVAKNFGGINYLQGHYHSRFFIDYVHSNKSTFWAGNTGALCDDQSLAMAYGRNTYKKSVLGAVLIVDSKPLLIPMVLDKNNRWDKKLLWSCH